MYFLMWAVMTLTRRQRSRYQTMLGWTFVAWTLSNLKDIIITFPELYTEQVQNYILIVDGWMAISFTILIFEITMPGWTTRRRFLLLGIPWLLFTAVYIVWPLQAVIRAYIVYLWCYAWVIIAIAYFKGRKYIRYIRNNFSNIDQIDISWLKYFFWFCIVCHLSWLATSLMYNVYADSIYYISTILMWQMVIHYSYHFTPISIEPQQPLTATQVKDYTFAEKVDEMVEQEKLYLSTDLSLEELANRLHTNRTYLSDYFNRVKQTTFYDYINQLRIERIAVPMIQQHPEYTIEYIAAKSGFKSLSTFRRSFLKLKDVTPSQYRSQFKANNITSFSD